MLQFIITSEITKIKMRIQDLLSQNVSFLTIWNEKLQKNIV
jgi:hypothetical protein